jgi:iron complex transport system ATP-binding protein
MEKADPKLELRRLVFDYPKGVRAVDGFDVSLRSGEIVCLCGPNGSGKSTVLKLASGLLEPTEGEVRIDGIPLASLSKRERARLLASVPQRLEALGQSTVLSFVLGGRYARSSFLERALGGVSHQELGRVEEALAKTDAAELKERRLVELSGGQCQRVLVARALFQRASVLLFDEPTAMLDPAHQVQVFRLIASARDGGRSALVATHDLNLAGHFADRILLLQEGRVRALGAPGEILRPEVLGPIYGPDLHFQRLGERVLVVPWPVDAPG